MARQPAFDLESGLRAAVGTPHLVWAKSLVAAGAVTDVGLGRDGLRVRRVRDPEAGSTAIVYRAVLEQEPLRVTGSCTCAAEPCRHMVAVLLAGAGDELDPVAGREVELSLVPTPPVPATGPPVTSWATALQSLLGAERPAGDRPAGGEPAWDGLGLQFDALVLPRRWDGHPFDGLRLRVRPVQRGQSRKRGWIRTGISWADLEYGGYGRQSEARRRHRTLLAELRTLVSHHAYDSYYGSYHGSQMLDLTEALGPRVWDLLAEAVDAGVQLLQVGPAAAPVLLHGPVDGHLAARRTASGLVLEPGLRTQDGTDVPRHRVLELGSEPGRPAGLAWWDGPEAPIPGFDDGPAGAGTLHLAPVPKALTARVPLLAGMPEVLVPPEEEQEFRGTVYPELVRTLPIRQEPDVDLPQPEPPVLVCRVEPDGVDRAGVTWEWLYQLGVGTVRAPLVPVQEVHREAATRDVPVELDVLDRVGRLVRVASRSAAPGEPAPRWFDPTGTLERQVELHGMAVARLFTELLPALQRMPGVRVEVLGEVAAYREAENAPELELTPLTGTDRDWLDLAVTVTVDGEDVPFELLFTALTEGQRFLLLPSGTFVRMDDPRLAELAQLIEESRTLGDAPPQVMRVGRCQSDVLDELDRIGVLAGQAQEWQRRIRAVVEAPDRPPLPPPAGLQAELRPYQLAGFSWLASLYDNGLGGVLADDMGLGKTVQTLALFCHAQEQAEQRGGARPRFLVVTPTSVVDTWRREAERFAPGLRVETVTGTGRRRGVPIAELAAGADLLVTSYTLFRLEREQYDEVGWAGLVLDEAQTVKNHRSQGYRCARTLPVPFTLAITGTPLENTLMELWALLSLTSPGLLPPADRFTEHYRTPIERGGDGERLAVLRRRIAPMLLRRTKREVAADLPDKQEQVLEVELHPRHRKVYQAYLQRERRRVLGLVDDLEQHRFEILRSLTLLRQASLDLSLVDPEHAGIPAAKLDVLVDLVREVAAEGHRVLVFSQFTRFLGKARSRLEEAGIGTCYLDGSTRDRAEVIEGFRAGTAPAFLISLKAGGTGLTLTEADYCILLDPWWNPATENQAVDRVHRIGQTRKVMVYRLVAKDTVEHKVMALKAAKDELFRSVLDGGDLASTALTADDIRHLVE